MDGHVCWNVYLFLLTFYDVLLPYKKRPTTTAAVARNLVTGALGVKSSVTPEQRRKERTMLKEARGKCKYFSKVTLSYLKSLFLQLLSYTAQNVESGWVTVYISEFIDTVSTVRVSTVHKTIAMRMLKEWFIDAAK